ncbi:hypothetical protein [Thermococcus sp.]
MVDAGKVKIAVPSIALILMLAGAANVSGAELSGKVLHVWSHDTSSLYTEIHVVNRNLNDGDTFAVEQTVFAVNYSGSAGVALLEVQVTNSNGKTKWYSIYWFGKDKVYLYTPTSSISLNLGMSKPHRYRIELTKSTVKFVIDSNTIELPADVKKIQQVNSGRWDNDCTYDLYIDDVKEYWNGELTTSEDFEDGIDNYYTSDHTSGNGDSGEKVIESIGVPEFPFISGLVKGLSSLLSMEG